MKTKIILIGLITFLINFISCSEIPPTKEEMIVIKKYTTKENHDSLILGKWIPNESWEMKDGTKSKTYIAFEEKGIIKKRTYRDGKPHNDNEWSINQYFYHTKNGKLYQYKPSEKGFLAMDDEIFIENEYSISDDGKILTLDKKIYKRLE